MGIVGEGVHESDGDGDVEPELGRLQESLRRRHRRHRPLQRQPPQPGEEDDDDEDLYGGVKAMLPSELQLSPVTLPTRSNSTRFVLS